PRSEPTWMGPEGLFASLITCWVVDRVRSTSSTITSTHNAHSPHDPMAIRRMRELSLKGITHLADEEKWSRNHDDIVGTRQRQRAPHRRQPVVDDLHLGCVAR